jgi:hypothetical protein
MSNIICITYFLQYSLIQVAEGSPEYNLLAERNALDMILYNFITLLFVEQKSLIDSYA